MQIKFFFLTVGLFLSFVSVAERSSMTVYVPQTSGAAMITGNGVNLRKNPSPSSPQLVCQMDAEMEGSDEIPENTWSDTPVPKGYGRSPYQLYEGKAVPVVKEAEGWSQIIIDNLLPWVKNTFVSAGMIQKLGIGIPPAEYSPRIALREMGSYEDFCAVYYPHELFGERIFLGYYKPELFRSHLAICPLSLECITSFNPNIKGIYVKKTSYGNYEVSFGSDAAFTDNYGNRTIDLGKLTDLQFKNLLDIAKVDSEELILYAFQDKTHDFILSPGEYKGAMTEHEIILPSLSSSQPKESTVSSTTVYDTCDVLPSFPGGLGEMMAWLGRNINYPPAAAENGIMGRVLVKFIVSADGSIRNAQVIRGVHPDLDKEALRVVMAMPKWIPGTKGGRPVNTWFNIPVTFKLNN